MTPTITLTLIGGSADLTRIALPKTPEGRYYRVPRFSSQPAAVWKDDAAAMESVVVVTDDYKLTQVGKFTYVGVLKEMTL